MFTSAAFCSSSANIVIIPTNNDRAERRKIHLWWKTLFDNQPIHLIVIWNDWCAPTLALVIHKTLKRVENVLYAIVQVENCELGILKIKANLNLKFVGFRIANVTLLLNLDDCCVNRPTPSLGIGLEVWDSNAKFQSTFRHLLVSSSLTQ